MLRNYIKLFFRNFKKDLQFSVINLAGLSLGLAVVLLIFLYLHFDFTYDSYFAEADEVYLVYEAGYQQPGLVDKQERFRFSPQEGISKSPFMPTPLGPYIGSDLPEIASYSRFTTWDAVFQLDNGPLAKEMHFADSGFFGVFSYRFIEGDPARALQQLHGIVLTASTARSLFGDAKVLGESLVAHLGEEAKTFTVTGVVADPPGNISFPFECLTRIENRPYFSFHKENWNAFNCPLLLRLTEKANAEAVSKKLTAIAHDRYAKSIERRKATNGLGENDRVLDFALYPLSWVHHSVDLPTPGFQNPRYSLILLVVGLLILTIACLNFIILSISKSGGRRMEVGIRKVMGARKGHLFWQFQVESFMYVVVSVLLSFGLMEILLPAFNRLSGLQLTSHYPFQAFFAIAIVALAVAVGFLSGVYPSTYLARLQPVASLKRGTSFTIKKGLLKWLVIGQLTISMVLIVSTFTMRRQMRYVEAMDLGFDKENVLVLNTASVRSATEPWLHHTTIKNTLLSLPEVARVTGTNASFAKGWARYGFKIDGNDFQAVTYLADEDYLPLLDIDLLHGRNFIAGSEADHKYSVIVNEAFVKMVGWEDALGQQVPWYEADKPIRVIGVIKDYHFFSLESEITPMLLFAEPSMEPFSYMLVRLHSGTSASAAVAAIENKWKQLYPDKPLSWSFLDQDLDNQYKAYSRWISYMQYATSFALIIGCLGLFGLSRIISHNRVKEIGVRKVFGAGMADILRLLNVEIVKMVLVSASLGIPLGIWVMNQWLDHFQFHITIGWQIAAVSLVLALTASLVSVGFQTIKTAFSNPIESLRHE